MSVTAWLTVGDSPDEVGGAMLATTLSSRNGYDPRYPAKAAMPPSEAPSGSGGRLVERWRGGPPAPWCCGCCRPTGDPELKGGRTSPGRRRAESGLGLEWSLCGCAGWNIDRLPVTSDSPKVSTLKRGVVGACEDRTVVSSNVMGVGYAPQLCETGSRDFERATDM